MVSVFPGFGVGGAQLRFVALAAHFGAAFSHVIVSLSGETACRERLPARLDVRFADAGPKQRGLAATVATATRVLRAEAPDLVVTSNWGAIEWAMAARLCGFRHVHTEDGFGPEERQKQIPRRAITRRLALRGSDVILPSRTLFTIATTIWRLPERRLHYIPNGIDLQRFAPRARRPPGTIAVIGTIAALRAEKNIFRLIEAFAQVRETLPSRLVIVGGGPERPALEEKAAAMGLADAVTFAGHTDAPETWLAQFDLFVVSSDTEQMPLSVLEAMASGLPVASTDVGDIATMLARPHVSDETPGGLAAAMLAAMADTEAGPANLARAREEFDQELMFRRYGEILLRSPA